jgi:hypothetical protein
MIFLNTINETLELKTSSTADIDFQINYVDIIPASSATPGSNQGKSTIIGTIILLSAPSSTISRQIKSVFIRNRNTTTSNTVSIIKDVSGVEYLLTGDILLQAGATITYESNIGWSLGTILINTLTNDYHTAYQDWQAIIDPVAPAAGDLRVYAKPVSGRMLPKWKGPSGLDTPFQPAFFGNNIVMWNPGLTSGAMIGGVQAVITAGVSTLPSITSRYSSLRRSVFTSATGVNTMNSLRSEAAFFRGSTTGAGGFFFFCRFGFTTWTMGDRLFVGMCVDTTALLTADPSAKFNTLGFGVDAADIAISFMHNDSVGIATKDAIAGQPALSSNNAYDAYIFCRPNDTTVFYRLDDVTGGTTLIDTSTSVDLPISTTMLIATCGIGSGLNATAGAAAIGLNRMYIESDY